MKKEDILNQYKDYVMHTYTQTPLILAKGRGAKVWDVEGNE